MDTDSPPLIERLEACTPQELKTWHASLSNAHVPRRAKSTYLKGQIAWLEQAKAEGLEMEAFQNAILEQLSQCNTTKPTLSPGTRLLREWHGRTYTVDVLPSGFAFNGEIFGSLSEIARIITGTRWSGPRFFGLKGASHG